MGNKKKNFLMQGSILALAGIISRVIGLVFKIPMGSIIGEDGMGVYTTAYNIYNILLLISSYSLPMAVSKLISAKFSLKQYKNVQRIFILSLCFGAALGLIAALVMYFGADFFAGKVVNMPEAVFAIRALAPAVLVMGFLGVMRGFFQGQGTMIPTAVSQIIEQVLHVAISLLAGAYFFKKGVAKDAGNGDYFASAYGAEGATLGVTAGALAALLFLILLFMLYRDSFMAKQAKDNTGELDGIKKTLQLIALTAVPVLISATISNISSLIDQSLFAKYIGDDYRSIWGAYNYKYSVLINVPIAIATALSSSTMPAISASMVQGKTEDVRRKAASAIRFVMLIAIPATVGLGALGKPCCDLLFRNQDNVLAGRMLAIGSGAVLTYSVSTLTVGILQGTGHFWTPIKNSLKALAIHIPLLALSLWVFRLGIMAVVVNHALLTLFTSYFNLRSLNEKVEYRQEYRVSFFLVLVCSVMMGGAAYACYLLLHHYLFGNSLSLLFAIFVGVVIYVLAIFFVGAVKEEDLRSMPKGAAIVRMAKKMHLIK